MSLKFLNAATPKVSSQAVHPSTKSTNNTEKITMIGAIAYTREEFQECIDMMASKKIDMKKFVDDVVGLSGVQGAFERLTSGNDDAIKILIDPSKK